MSIGATICGQGKATCIPWGQGLYLQQEERGHAGTEAKFLCKRGHNQISQGLQSVLTACMMCLRQP